MDIVKSWNIRRLFEQAFVGMIYNIDWIADLIFRSLEFEFSMDDDFRDFLGGETTCNRVR